MQITSKSGLKLTLEISGTQEEPVIMLESVEGKPTIKGLCQIAASQKRTNPGIPMPADSLFCKNAKVFIQVDLAPIRAAIAALPTKARMAKKIVREIDLDGERCPVHEWSFDALLRSPKTGEVIDTADMGRFLDSKNVSEIEIAKACQMWAEEMETTERLAAQRMVAERSRAVSQHFADMEEMENGYALTTPRDPTPAYPREG